MSHGVRGDRPGRSQWPLALPMERRRRHLEARTIVSCQLLRRIQDQRRRGATGKSDAAEGSSWHFASFAANLGALCSTAPVKKS
ncbi:hypothetical protein CCHR01_12287 [Colletotrichum chrysophilum]|uniref:Uncharacterized protein n=1 Tax=Colletotrichum chrysophilum TaxID=1836956 RepID=A0AAD9ABI9_9PEZI|nr:hypothetical protein K456DRAFT_1732407 [Colletotrichum gloeosporioides 23]KAK1845068.1 hypothetical protein CCHR01_12287 [Colletotrichum chrysophilum]